MKIVTIVGARPQFIKAAVVSSAFSKFRKDVREVIVHTGQHFDVNMSDIFFSELNIPPPDHNLGIGGGSHGQNTGRMLEAIEIVLMQEKPDWVIVYGDTDSTLAGALAAAKLHIRIAHIEAGLRSFNRRMPEEINRVLTDHASHRLFAPTESAMNNLRREGIVEDKLELVGDVMYDAVVNFLQYARTPGWFEDLKLASSDYVLATIHRAENTDDPRRLAGILRGLEGCGQHVILPLHPRTRDRLASLRMDMSERIHLVPPSGYLEMLWLESHAKVIATDSGGVQKEAFFHAKPCVTLRDETEWLELVDAGWNFLAGSDEFKIAELLNKVRPQSIRPNLYGVGDSAIKIVEKL